MQKNHTDGLVQTDKNFAELIGARIKDTRVRELMKGIFENKINFRMISNLLDH